MSARAAWRLETLGFQQVCDYAAGKADWLAFGLPRVGRARLAIDVLDRDVPTCGPGARAADVRGLLERPTQMAVVVNDAGVVLGLLEPSMFDGASDRPVAALMAWGPATIRPSEALDDLADRMERASAEAVIVTSPEGRLLGLVTRQQAAAASGPHARRRPRGTTARSRRKR